MLAQEDITRLLKEGLFLSGDFAEVFGEECITISVLIEDEKVKVLPSSEWCGIGIRVISGDRTGYAYCDEVEMTSLLEAARSAAAIAEGHRALSMRRLDEKRPSRKFTVRTSPSTITEADKVILARKAEQAARTYDKCITEVTVRYMDLDKEWFVANSEGLLVRERHVLTHIFVSALAIRGEKKHLGREMWGGYVGWEIFDEISPEEIGRRAAKKAVVMLDAREAPAGNMPVVIGCGDGAVLLHEAVGHGLEADIVQHGGSIYAGKIGQKVASPLVTLVDDPTVPNMGGSINIDDEGTDTQRTLLIEKGVLCGYLYDRLSALKDGVRSTGNGRRQSFKHFPIPRMTNTCLLPGDKTPEEIIEATSHGLYVKSIGAGQVNASSGDFTFEVTEGYVIEKGKIAYPVKGASLIGRGIDVLSSIDMVGNDFAFGRSGSTCGKGQAAHVDFAQPTLRVKEMTVGGTRH